MVAEAETAVFALAQQSSPLLIAPHRPRGRLYSQRGLDVVTGNRAPFAGGAVRLRRQLNGVRALPVLDFHHLDRVPGTTVQEGSVGSLAGTFCAADAGSLVDLDSAKRRVVRVGDPKHAGLNRAVGHANRRASAPRAVFVDDGQLLGLAFSEIRPAARHRLELLYRIQRPWCCHRSSAVDERAPFCSKPSATQTRPECTPRGGAW